MQQKLILVGQIIIQNQETTERALKSIGTGLKKKSTNGAIGEKIDYPNWAKIFFSGILFYMQW